MQDEANITATSKKHMELLLRIMMGYSPPKEANVLSARVEQVNDSSPAITITRTDVLEDCSVPVAIRDWLSLWIPQPILEEQLDI